MVETTPRFGRELRLLPPTLARGCGFLQSTMISGGGWPDYSGGKFDLRNTALCLRALKSCSENVSDPIFTLTSFQVAEIVDMAKSSIGRIREVTRPDVLGSFIIILETEDQPDGAAIELAAKRLSELLESQLMRPNRVQLREFCYSMTFLSAYPYQKSVIKDGYNFLTRIQSPMTGGWPNTEGGEPTVFATACAVTALISMSAIGDGDAIVRGIEFIESKIRKTGWEDFLIKSGTFAHCHILKSLVHYHRPELIESGVVTLEAASNGFGWGEGRSNQSTVELTALALDTLVQCGETRLVPELTARNSLIRIQSTVEHAVRKQGVLDSELVIQNDSQSRKILTDRDKARAEGETLKKNVAEVQALLIESQQEVIRITEKNRHLARRLSATDPGGQPLGNALRQTLIALQIAGCVLLPLLLFGPHYISVGRIGGTSNIAVLSKVLSAVNLLRKPSGEYVWDSAPFIALVTVLLSVSVLAAYVPGPVIAFTRRRLLLFRPVERGIGQSDLVGPFMMKATDFLGRLPSNLREDVGRIFLGRLIEMPPDVGRQYVMEVAVRMNLSRSVLSGLLALCRDFLEFDSVTRQETANLMRQELVG